jgi:hypothetical protein
MSPLVAFGLGFVGALLIETLPIYGLRKVSRLDWPDWLTSKAYWAISSAGFLVGGGFAAGYAMNSNISWLMALNVGAAWPVIVGGLADAAPSFKPGPDQAN